MILRTSLLELLCVIALTTGLSLAQDQITDRTITDQTISEDQTTSADRPTFIEPSSSSEQNLSLDPSSSSDQNTSVDQSAPIDPATSESGWDPHRDKGAMSLFDNGRPKSVTDVVDTVVWRILDQIGMPNPRAFRWCTTGQVRDEMQKAAKTSQKRR